jgi:signal transduction histidine kinase
MTELKHLEAENLKVKKLESIASLSGGIAHDFNNILTAVMGNLSLAKFSCHEDDELFTHLENAYAACLRAKDLTWKLLIFSRGGMPEKKEVNLRKVIEEAGSISLAGSQAAIVTDLRDDPIVVLGDRDLFTQVFHNLFMNAVHAMPDGERSRFGKKWFRARLSRTDDTTRASGTVRRLRTGTAFR